VRGGEGGFHESSDTAFLQGFASLGRMCEMSSGVSLVILDFPIKDNLSRGENWEGGAFQLYVSHFCLVCR
jgi:hypothetical protein